MTYHVDQMALVTAITKELSRQIPDLPFEPRFYNRVIQAANSICDELASPLVKSVDGMGLTAWLASDDVGMSSKYMASVLSGGEFSADFAYPIGVADLGRCIRMIRAIPEFADRIQFMSTGQGLKWAVVAENWGEWVALYDKEQASGKCPELYTSMKLAYKETGE